MSAPHPLIARRVRNLGILATALNLALALLVRLGLDDGGWPLFVPALGAALVAGWPTRGMVILAVIVNAAFVVLGLMTVGIWYGFGLAVLIYALAMLRSEPDGTTVTHGSTAIPSIDSAGSGDSR